MSEVNSQGPSVGTWEMPLLAHFCDFSGTGNTISLAIPLPGPTPLTVFLPQPSWLKFLCPLLLGSVVGRILRWPRAHTRDEPVNRLLIRLSRLGLT